MINNIGQLDMFQPQDSSHLNITINKVEKVRLVSGPLLEEEHNQPSAAILYVAIIISCVLLVLLLAMLWILLTRTEVILPFKRQKLGEPDTKKVSRVESWRYQPTRTARQPAATLTLPQERRTRHNTFHGDLSITYTRPQDCIATSQSGESQYTSHYSH